MHLDIATCIASKPSLSPYQFDIMKASVLYSALRFIADTTDNEAITDLITGDEINIEQEAQTVAMELEQPLIEQLLEVMAKRSGCYMAAGVNSSGVVVLGTEANLLDMPDVSIFASRNKA